MTTLTEPATQTRTRTTLLSPVLYWHLLSLDAPTVAALWTYAVARTVHLHLPITAIAAMFLAVWILYAADRLLDSRLKDGEPPSSLEARHRFHHHHRRLFRIAIVFSSLALAPLLLTIPPEALRLYLIAGSLLFAWFILIHVTPTKQNPARLPKELAVGVFFAAATFIPTVARQPALRLILLPAAILFATLCSLNCLFIYAWEHPAETPAAHATTRFALRHLTLVAPILTVAALFTALIQHISLPIPIALSATLLLTLHRTRPHNRTLLRAAADLTLLTPILFLPFQH